MVCGTRARRRDALRLVHVKLWRGRSGLEFLFLRNMNELGGHVQSGALFVYMYRCTCIIFVAYRHILVSVYSCWY